MKDLEFLKNADSTDLQVLVDYLTKNKNGNFRATESLSYTQNYHIYYPNRLPLMYDEIAEELLCFGGNTFRNIIRGGGPSYRTVLIDVCKKMKVNFNRNASIETIENNLIEKILLTSLDQMSEDDLKKLLEDLDIPTKGIGETGYDSHPTVCPQKRWFRQLQNRGNCSERNLSTLVGTWIVTLSQRSAHSLVVRFCRTYRLGGDCCVDVTRHCRSCLPCHHPRRHPSGLYAG